MNSKYRYFVPLVFFMLIFLIVSVASFYFLPEGILKEVNVDKDVSDNTTFLMSECKQNQTIIIKNLNQKTNSKLHESISYTYICIY